MSPDPSNNVDTLVGHDVTHSRDLLASDCGAVDQAPPVSDYDERRGRDAGTVVNHGSTGSKAKVHNRQRPRKNGRNTRPETIGFERAAPKYGSCSPQIRDFDCTFNPRGYRLQNSYFRHDAQHRYFSAHARDLDIDDLSDESSAVPRGLARRDAQVPTSSYPRDITPPPTLDTISASPRDPPLSTSPTSQHDSVFEHPTAHFGSLARYDSDDDCNTLSGLFEDGGGGGGNHGPTPVVAPRPASGGAEITDVRPPSDAGTHGESTLLERLAGLKIDDGDDAESSSGTEPAEDDRLVPRARPLRPRRKGIDTYSDAADEDDENPFSLYPEIDDIGQLFSPTVVIGSAGRRGGSSHTEDDHRGDVGIIIRPVVPGQPATLPGESKKPRLDWGDRQGGSSSSWSATDGSEEKRGSGSPAPPKTRKRGRCESSTASLFVCPYVRYNPDKYEKWSSCRRGAWSSTHRVKEHLYRVHQGKPFCPRCGATFEAEDEVRGHLSRPEGVCERALDGFEVEGFDAAQEKKLHSRKRKRTSEEENWRDIFRILFPGEISVPDPYYRSTHSKPDRPVSSDDESALGGENARQMEAALARVEEIIKQPLDKRQRLEMLAVFGDLGTKRSPQVDDGEADVQTYAVYPTNNLEPEPNFGFSSSPTLPSSSSLDLHSDEAAGDGHAAGTDPYPFVLDSMAASADFWPAEETYLEKFDADAFIQQYQNPYPEYDENAWRVGDGLVGSGYVYESTSRSV